MQKDHRMASLFVIAGFSICFFLVINSVQLMNVIFIENEETKHMTAQWFDFDTESYLEMEGAEEGVDFLVKHLFSLLTQDASHSISIVDYWVYEENIMDSVEINVIFKKQRDNQICRIGKAYQDHYLHPTDSIREIVLSGEKYIVNGVQQKSSPYVSDDKVYLYWDNMTERQQENLLEIISNDIAGGVILTMEVDESSKIKKQYQQKIQDELGISLIKHTTEGGSGNFDARIYTSFGKILCPIVLLFSIFNTVIVVQFWVRTNQKEWFIRRYLGYDLFELWRLLVKHLMKFMLFSMLLGLTLEIIYMQLFRSIVLIQKNIFLELIMIFFMLVIILLLLSVAAICETAKYTESIERTKL